MSERKVLNKYYPPEFDPSKIPKLKCGKNKTFSIRIMAPFNMRCNVCGEYIYKGKKFNSRKENVDDEDYLGLRIFRFYIRCPRCVAEIAFKTDLANTDYTCEAGATRLFEAEKLAMKQAEQERKEKEADELNPMKVLENRTAASRNEMEQIDQLEELREMNARNAKLDHSRMLSEHMVYEEQLLKLQEEEEDKLVQSILNQGKSSDKIRRIDDTVQDDVTRAKKPKLDKSANPTDILAEDSAVKSEDKGKEPWQKSVGSFSRKNALAGLVKRKTPAAKSNTPAATATSSDLSVTTSSTESTHGANKDCGSSCVDGGPTSQPGTSGLTEPAAPGTSAPVCSSPAPVKPTPVTSVTPTPVASSSSSNSQPSLGALGMLGGYSDSEDSQSD